MSTRQRRPDTARRQTVVNAVQRCDLQSSSFNNLVGCSLAGLDRFDSVRWLATEPRLPASAPREPLSSGRSRSSRPAAAPAPPQAAPCERPWFPSGGISSGLRSTSVIAPAVLRERDPLGIIRRHQQRDHRRSNRLPVLGLFLIDHRAGRQHLDVADAPLASCCRLFPSA